MNHGSLFSGIGGFDLAAEWAGWTNVFQVESNKYCQQVLKNNFPDARIYGDIREFDGRPWRGTVDVISGGFPCQPYSSAGKRLGKEDDRHLWPDMLRVIREAAPRWVVGENVRGLVNWSGGLVFDEVQADLEAAGYEVQPFLLPAASVNAPHIRYRVWFVACRPDVGRQRSGASWGRGDGFKDGRTASNAKLYRGIQSNGKVETEKPYQNGKKWNFGNANNKGLEERQRITGNNGAEQPPAIGANNRWANWPTQPPVCGGDDGVSIGLDESKQLSTNAKTKSKEKTSAGRAQRIAALGNAVVPQLVWRIFDTINQFEHEQQQKTLP